MAMQKRVALQGLAMQKRVALQGLGRRRECSEQASMKQTDVGSANGFAEAGCSARTGH
jgi:hypothetical protein